MAVLAREAGAEQAAAQCAVQLQRASSSLLVALLSLLLGASPRLHALHHQSLNALFASLDALVDALLTRSRDAAVPSLTGAVWARVEALRTCPLEEQEAARRAWETVATASRDAHRELHEALQEPRSEEEEEEEEGDAYVWRIELLQAERCAQLIRLAAMLVTQLHTLFSPSTANSDLNPNSLALTSNQVQVLWVAVARAEHVGELIDECAFSAYSPQDAVELNARSSALRSALLELVDKAADELSCLDPNRSRALWTLLPAVRTKILKTEERTNVSGV